MASPILYVEMLTVGRRRRYFLLRVVYALLLLVTAWFCYEATFRSYRSSPLKDQADFANGFFIAFAWIQLIAVTLITPAMLAGTVASEHERRTIDYLLTTPLNDWEIALGKFTARLGAVATQLAVGWPILAIFMTLGGVGPAQLAAVFGVAVLSLCSTAALSLAISVRAKKSREAITRTYLIMIALLSIPPMATGICAMFQHSRDFPLIAALASFLLQPMGWLTSFNPFVFLVTVLIQGPVMLPMSFGMFAAGHLVVTAFLLLSSVFGVRRFYLRAAGAATKSLEPIPVRAAQPVKAAPQAVVPTTEADELTEAEENIVDVTATYATASSARRAPWGRTLGENPMLWKELVSERTSLKLGILGRIASFLLYGFAIFWILLAFFYSFEDRYFSRDSIRSPMQIFGLSGVPMISFLALLLITSRAAGSLTSEKEQDTWLSLISTPLDGREIVRAKIFGAICSVRYWYYLVGIVWILSVLLYPPFIVAVPFLAVAHGMAAFCCASIGVRASLKSPTSLKAMGGALATIVFAASIAPLIVSGIFQTIYLTPFSLPTLVWMVHGFFMTIFADFWQSTSRRFPGEFVGLCFTGGIAFCGYLALTWGAYRSAIDRFDEFAGRVIPRSRVLPATIGPPRSTEPSSGSGDTIHYG